MHCLLCIWLKVYEDSLKRVDAEIAGMRANRVIEAMPEELKKLASERQPADAGTKGEA